MTLLTSDYTTLRNEFNAVLTYPINLNEKTEDTFLEISGFPNYENVWSNLYQYFLNDKRANINRLFLLSLQDCITKTDFNMESWIAEREVITKSDGRIDLVVREDEIENGKVIIIENKIYHTLQNNLDDYYETFSGYSERILIVLSLNAIDVNKKYYNITHKQWIQAIKNRLSDYITNLDARQLIFLQDFIRHIDSFYEKPLTMEVFKFLFENAEKINALNQLQQESKKQLQKELQENLPNEWEFFRTANNSISFRRKDIDFILYVTLDGLFKSSDHHYNIQLWVKGELLVKQWKIASAFQSFSDISIHKNESSKDWALMASKKYPIDFEGIQNFGKLINGKMINEWEKFCLEIRKELL